MTTEAAATVRFAIESGPGNGPCQFDGLADGAGIRVSGATMDAIIGQAARKALAMNLPLDWDADGPKTAAELLEDETVEAVGLGITVMEDLFDLTRISPDEDGLYSLPVDSRTVVVRGAAGAGRTLHVVYDVTGLAQDQINALTIEAVVQGEASEDGGDTAGHPDVTVEVYDSARGRVE